MKPAPHLVPIGIVLFLLGVAMMIGSTLIDTNNSAPSPTATFGSNDPDTITTSDPAPASGRGALVSVPSLKLEVPWTAVGNTSGTLDVPSAPLAGWYEQSAAIGATSGTAVIAGHVDRPDGSPAPFGSLSDIQKGASIYVADEAGKLHHYRVTELSVYKQQALPASIFTKTGSPTLVLVTCSGSSIQTPAQGARPWSYEENLTVTATLIG